MSSAALQGNLETFKLADVLTFLNATRRTGMLTLTRGANETYVFLRDGSAVYAASNLDKAPRIDATEGEMKRQVSDVIFDAFVWGGGEFAFFDGIDLPANAVTIAIDLSNLIMEGARRISEWEECLRLLPDSSAVFRLSADPEREKITLTLDEWKILFLINGQRTIEDICRESGSDAFRIYRVIYGLLANDLITSTHAAEDDATESPGADALAAGDATVREMPDDTNLLVSEDARLTYKDIVRKTVAQLLIMGGDAAGTVVPLVENEYRIGRHRDNEIQLDDLGVSAYHARIFRGPDGYVIEDLKSRNGTWVNGTRAFQSILNNGDEIRVGATDLRYETLFDAPAEGVRAGVSRPPG
ncbi:MAG TPA: DUF4388 domain-containing protein [Thermoanaerobaculia bacterium]|nr:DUF4388 domain-containing protein [Thermoanaerobaculia bacterium]